MILSNLSSGVCHGLIDVICLAYSESFMILTENSLNLEIFLKFSHIPLQTLAAAMMGNSFNTNNHNLLEMIDRFKREIRAT